MSQNQAFEDPLKILMVLRAPVGGLYRHVIDLTEELSKRGHRIGLIMDSSHVDAQTNQRIDSLSVPLALGVHRFPIPRLLGPGDIFATLHIRKIAKQFNVDVLHGHGAKGGFNARISRLGRKNTIATYTPHGGVLNYEQKTLIGKVLRLIEKSVLRFTDGILFESAFAKSAFEAQIGKAPSFDPVVLNGLLPGDFAPLDPKLIAFDFAYVGELRSVKGIRYMLEGLVDVTRPDGTPANLILGGGGPDESDIKQRIVELGLEQRVKMVGVQPALRVFEQGTIAVMPSLAESLPYVALEAAAAAKPLIATNVGGVDEIFGPTKSALLPAANSGALQIAMQKALDDPKAALEEMELRLDWVKSNFNVDKMASEIEQTYYACLKKRSPGR